jgi:hypothetical protein
LVQLDPDRTQQPGDALHRQKGRDV